MVEVYNTLQESPEYALLKRSTFMHTRMPGFTADPAVYGSGGLRYGMAEAMVVPAQGAVVGPLASPLCLTVFDRSFGPLNVRVLICGIGGQAICMRVTFGGATVFNRCFP